MSTESTVTWQKMTVIIALLTLALPVAARFGWQLVFPPNYLLYETTHTTKVSNIQTASVIVVNAGNSTQRDVALYLPSDSTDAKITSIEVSSPRRSNLRSLFEAEPQTPIAKYSQESGFKIPMGNIAPEEEVRVTLTATSKTDEFLPTRLSLSEARVESSSMSGIEADGVRYPAFSDDPHTMYVQLSPYLLAAFSTLFGLIMLISLLHDIFFNTPQKQMTRLWRQMDDLQEKIDKERRYQ